MANRVMQQKIHKMQRQRRAWARPLSIGGGKTPAKGVIQEYKHRAKGLGVDEAEIDRLILETYGHLPFACTPSGKTEIKELLRRLKEDVPQLYFFDIFPENCYQRVRCYHNAQRSCFIIVHDNFRRRVIHQSIEYHDKDLAVSKWHSGKVTWIKHTPILPSSAPPRE